MHLQTQLNFARFGDLKHLSKKNSSRKPNSSLEQTSGSKTLLEATLESIDTTITFGLYIFFCFTLNLIKTKNQIMRFTTRENILTVIILQ